jgi:hypothetical protein
MEFITPEAYFEAMSVAFPKLKKALQNEDEKGLNHLKMEHFSRYTNDQIRKRDNKEFMRCLAFQEAMIDVMPPEIENALLVSYCESLLLGQYGLEMKKKVKNMPPKFKAQYEYYADWYYNLYSKDIEE